MSLRRLCGLVLFAVLPAMLRGQDRVAIGPRFGYHDLVEGYSIGGEVKIPLSSRLALRPGVDFINIDFGSYRSYNIDLQYSLTPALYFGGGVASRWLSAGDANGDVLGWNLFAGVELPRGTVRPFAEARAFVKSGTSGYALAGVRVTL